MKQLLSAIVFGALLAGCASTKLDESAASTATATAPATNAPAAASQVAPVVANTAPAAGGVPANAARTIYFDYDSDAIRPEFQAAIDAHARYLARQRGRTVAIAGHTDERGGREYNLALGQRRAEAVRAYLMNLGVDGGRLATISYGEEKPLEEGDSDDAMAHNRRAEFDVTGGDIVNVPAELRR